MTRLRDRRARHRRVFVSKLRPSDLPPRARWRWVYRRHGVKAQPYEVDWSDYAAFSCGEPARHGSVAL
jgi:hypothetical protein